MISSPKLNKKTPSHVDNLGFICSDFRMSVSEITVDRNFLWLSIHVISLREFFLRNSHFKVNLC